MKITKKQLKRIIQEMKDSVLEEQQMTPDSEIMDRLKDGLMAVGLDRIVNQGDNILESEIVQFVMDTSTSDRDRIYDAIEKLAVQLNVM